MLSQGRSAILTELKGDLSTFVDAAQIDKGLRQRRDVESLEAYGDGLNALVEQESDGPFAFYLVGLVVRGVDEPGWQRHGSGVLREELDGGKNVVCRA